MSFLLKRFLPKALCCAGYSSILYSGISLTMYETANASSNLTSALQYAKTHHLDQHKAWHDLLHYRNSRWSSPESQADDPDFFLTPTGDTDAARELKASITALFAAPTENAFSCKFPARARWLRKTLQLPEQSDAHCVELNKYRNEINAKSISLIFASTYLNSPSSMFGHTFLRLDSDTSKTPNRLLSSTISYAADADEHENEFMFAYRGLFGGYPGITSVAPYYTKLKQYIDMENRDIWEYRLNLTQSELDQLVDHAWELKDKNFDYYFFDENCAYRLMTLMDVARPGTALIDDVIYQAIPSDTVRWVIGKGLVDNIEYRPSTYSMIAHQLAQLEPAEQTAIQKLVNTTTPLSTLLTPFSDEQRARILDVGFEYIRYKTVSSKLTREQTAKRSYEILQARSGIKADANLSPTPKPPTRDDEGHATGRAGIKIGQAKHHQLTQNYVDIDIRPAYHDLTDIPDGYPQGTQLKFLDTSLRVWLDEQDVKLQHLTLIDINSISARDDFFSPVSWKVALGASRQITSTQAPLVPYIKGGSGMAYNLAGGYAFGYLQGFIEAHRDLAKGYNIGPGIELGWVRQTANAQTLLTIDYEHILKGESKERYTAKFTQGFSLNAASQVLLNMERHKQNNHNSTAFNVEYRHYF